jgi:hypothetical protein
MLKTPLTGAMIAAAEGYGSGTRGSVLVRRLIMISSKLVAMIEDHAEQLSAGLVSDLQRHPSTTAYHRFAPAEVHRRAYEVYRNLSKWVTRGSESEIEASYTELGRRRFQEGVPLSHVIFALILTKDHLVNHVKVSGLSDSALELYQELELLRVVAQFFDRAIYHTVQGYEQAAQR